MMSLRFPRYNICMTTPTQVFGCSDPAVIVASSNSGLRRQIVQDLCCLASAPPRPGRRRRHGQTGEQRMPAAAARSPVAGSGRGGFAADHPSSLSRASTFCCSMKPGIPRFLRSGAAPTLAACSKRSAAGRLRSRRSALLPKAGPAAVEPLPGMVGPGAMHGAGVSHGPAGGAAHHSGADYRSRPGPARKLWPPLSIGSARVPASPSW